MVTGERLAVARVDDVAPKKPRVDTQALTINLSGIICAEMRHDRLAGSIKHVKGLVHMEFATTSPVTDAIGGVAEAGHLGYKMLEGVNDIAEMSEEQMLAARDLTDKMSMMAAYRLAHVLNTIFSY